MFDQAIKETPDILSVAPEEGSVLVLEYETGERRRFDATPYLRGDFFGRLADPAYFKQARVVFDGWYVAWPEGQDMAPDVLYECSEPVG